MAISGGGRCNVTQAQFEVPALLAGYPRGGGPALGRALHVFGVRETVAWFAARGVTLVAEADGRMFSTTNTSRTIVACLQTAAARAGVEVHLAERVLRVVPGADGRLKVHMAAPSSPVWVASTALLATGSARPGFKLAASLGHMIVPPVPSLFSFALEHPVPELAGVSVPDASVSVVLPAPDAPVVQRGPVLFTHWGLSGPAVIRASAWAARPLHRLRYHAAVHINWAPAMEAAELRTCLETLRRVAARKLIRTDPPADLPLPK